MLCRMGASHPISGPSNSLIRLARLEIEADSNFESGSMIAANGGRNRMGSRQSIVDYLVGQMATAGAVSARKMFGEYGVYCDGKMVALVCDDQLFVKPTASGRAHVGNVTEAPPYPGAK